MISALVGLGFIISIPAIWTLIFGQVTELPFGAEEPFQMISNLLHDVFEIVPLLEAPVDMFIAVIGIQFIIYTVTFVMWLINLIRG